MDVTVLDQLTAWAAGMPLSHLGWTTLDAGRFLIGAGSVYLIVTLLPPRRLENCKTSSETPGFRLTLMMLAQDAYLKLIGKALHLPQTFRPSRTIHFAPIGFPVAIAIALALPVLLNLPLLGLATMFVITSVMMNIGQAQHPKLGH